ncbi:MAG TPA: NADH-quinone oxidoreductase subunit C [Gammaproteobacteria bacterium]
MNRFDWLSELLARCEDEHILVRSGSAVQLAPAHVLNIDAEDWGRLAQIASDLGYRWSALWAEEANAERLLLNACFEHRGDYLVIRTRINPADPVLPSHTPAYPAANRPERHAQDMFGIRFRDHPDNRRWARHQAWTEKQFPLRKNFPQMGNGDVKTPPDMDYPFFQAQGSGVYEIPVGPVHAGIIEPGHFRFQAVGETVLNLEERLGYVHKGIEKIAEGRDAFGLAKLAGRISGDTTVAHTWAACMAMEHAARLRVPARALNIRAILAERERIANHLGDIGAICNDVAFSFAFMQFGRLRENLQRLNYSIFGHRLLMDVVIPGGVSLDVTPEHLDQLLQQGKALAKELDGLLPMLDDLPSLEDRLLGTGILTPDMAKKMGTVGYVGKASGQDYDLRRDHGYAPYNRLTVQSPVYQEGDVAQRVQVRADEIRYSLQLLEQLLTTLPSGNNLSQSCSFTDQAEGIGMVEGWRGEIISYVRFDDQQRVSRFFARDPSWLTWPALEQMIHGNIVPDFPVCNKSVNGSYSGHDL